MAWYWEPSQAKSSQTWDGCDMMLHTQPLNNVLNPTAQKIIARTESAVIITESFSWQLAKADDYTFDDYFNGNGIFREAIRENSRAMSILGREMNFIHSPLWNLNMTYRIWGKSGWRREARKWGWHKAPFPASPRIHDDVQKLIAIPTLQRNWEGSFQDSIYTLVSVTNGLRAWNIQRYSLATRVAVQHRRPFHNRGSQSHESQIWAIRTFYRHGDLFVNRRYRLHISPKERSTRRKMRYVSSNYHFFII